jgi:hypothetical protein
VTPKGPIDRVVTSGTFSLDGGTWGVYNNVWIVGDENEVIVVDAAHDAGKIEFAVGGRCSVRGGEGLGGLEAGVEVAEEDPGAVGPLRPAVMLHRGRGHLALARAGRPTATSRAGAAGVPGVENVAETKPTQLCETRVSVVGHEVPRWCDPDPVCRGGARHRES